MLEASHKLFRQLFPKKEILVDTNLVTLNYYGKVIEFTYEDLKYAIFVASNEYGPPGFHSIDIEIGDRMFGVDVEFRGFYDFLEWLRVKSRLEKSEILSLFYAEEGCLLFKGRIDT